MAKDLEVSDEMRKKIAEANADAIKREGLNPDAVEPWEDGYRTAERDDAFEWWYFDAQFDDGSTCVITYNTKTNIKPSGPLEPSILFIARSAEGERKSSFWKGEPGDLTASADACDVRIGPSWARGDLENYQLHAEADELVADLRIKRGAPSWRPGAAVTYLDPGKKKFFAWVVPVSYGTVEGELEVAGKHRSVKGTVYHDHNWGNFMLAQMLDHWYWGRAHVGDFSIIFSQLTSAGIFGLGAAKMHVFFLAKGEEILTDDGLPLHLVTADFIKGPGDRSYPTRLDLTWEAEEGSVRMAIRNPKLLEAIDGLGDTPARQSPLMHLITSPYYYDFEADLELDVDLKGVKAHEQGRVIYEQMLFHKKASGD
ncbi:MAG TPA: lipocalin-like domain-containing protein [Candidatus Anoxymicrobiaceae bacterium]